MEPSELLALDGSKSPVGDILLCEAIIDYMHRKPAAQIAKYSDADNRFAARPKA
jgi:hypothetical protein